MKEQEWFLDNDPRYAELKQIKEVEGPWQNEPDKIQFTDKETGLPCLIVRNTMGALCGYVGVSKGHPYFEKPYNDIDSISVHGGLTFSDKRHEGGGICHIVDDGEDDNVWWLGFDCAHSYDLVPGYCTPKMKELGMTIFTGKYGEVYKDVTYVKSECASLARQLKDLHA